MSKDSNPIIPDEKIEDINWYYDSYINNSDLTAKLYYHSDPRTTQDEPLVKGFLTSKLGFSIDHSWGERNNIIGSLIDSVKGAVGSLMDQGVGLIQDAFSRVSGYSVTTESWQNRTTSQNANLYKSFKGTKWNLLLPDLEFYIFSDIPPKNNLIRELEKLLGDGELNSGSGMNPVTMGKIIADAIVEKYIPSLDSFVRSDNKSIINSNNCRFGGGYEVGEFYNITMPPSKFRFTYTYNPNEYVTGSYSLWTNKGIIDNLVLSKFNTEFSDSVSSISGSPLYVKVSMSFDFAKEPTIKDILNFIRISNMYDRDNLSMKKNKIKNDDI